MGTLVLVLIVCVGLLAWLYSAVALALVATVLAFVSSAFVFGTVYFYLLVVAVSLLVVWSVSENPDYDDEDDGGMWSGVAFISVGLSALLLGIVNRDLLLFSDLPVGMKVVAVSGYFVAYLAMGAGWSWYKYRKFAKKRFLNVEQWRLIDLQRLMQKYGLESEEAVAQIFQKGGPDDIDRMATRGSSKFTEWEKEYNRFIDVRDYKDKVASKYRKLRPEYNVHRLMVWIGLWPWSFISSLLRDPVKFVYDMMLTFYEKIYMSIVGDAQREFEEKFSSK